MSQFNRKFLRPAGDVLLLLVALSAANLLIGRSDPGWLEINPAPFLAIPVLIGARYGFITGITAGLIAVAAILGGRYGLIGELPETTWGNHPVTLAAFPVLGALSGELRRLYAAKMQSLEAAHRRVRAESTRLELEVDLLRESNRNLCQDIALRGAELTAMDVELRDILSSGDAGIFGNTLEFLRRAGGVEEAVIYTRKGNGWNQIASSVHGAETTDLCELGITMADRACAENDLVTWAGLWNQKNSQNGASGGSPSPVGPWLAALPWSAPGTRNPQSVLMVKTMPLRQVTWDNFARISTVCRWVAGLAIARLTDTGTLTRAVPVKAAQFRSLLQLAADTSSGHCLPSALLALRPKTGIGAPKPAAIEAELAEILRPTDIFTKSKSAGSLLYVALLPLAGQRDAAEILTRFEKMSGRVIPVDGHVPADRIWTDLAAGVPDSDSVSEPAKHGGTSPPLGKTGPSAEPA